MKFSELKYNPNYITHEMEIGTFKERTSLTLAEEIDIVASVVEFVMNRMIVDGVVYDKKIANKFLLYKYAITATDIEFTDVELMAPNEIIETLINNNIDKEFYNSSQYVYLFDWILDLLKNAQEYSTTFVGATSALLEKLPEQLEALSTIYEDFDTGKFDNVLDFAKSANGGRSLN